MNPSPDVVIVGGGVAGLAVAYELHRRRVRFLLLEGTARLGGVILSEQVDDYVIDAGPDSLLVQKTEGIALCEELGLGARLVPTKLPRCAYIQRAGQLHALPAASVLGIPTQIGPFVRSRLFSWAGKARMGAEWMIPRRRDGADESIGAFMTRRFGAEATTYLAEPLLAGIHAGDVNRLSVHALFPRFTRAEADYGSLLQAFRRQPRAPSTGEGVFRSLPGGLSDLVRAIVTTLPVESIRLNTLATRIGPEANGFGLDTSAGERLKAPAVVLATPAYVTASMMTETSTTLSHLCGQIAYASAGTVVLAFRRDDVRHPLLGSGFVVPRVEHTGITAASWLSSKWPNRAPADRVLMRVFVGGARDPQALERNDVELVAVAMNALRPLLGISAPPLFSRVYRFDRANAQHEVGHLARMAAIEREIDRYPGLFLTGSGFRGVGIPDCIADGRATARSVTAWIEQRPSQSRSA